MRASLSLSLSYFIFFSGVNIERPGRVGIDPDTLFRRQRLVLETQPPVCLTNVGQDYSSGCAARCFSAALRAFESSAKQEPSLLTRIISSNISLSVFGSGAGGKRMIP